MKTLRLVFIAMAACCAACKKESVPLTHNDVPDDDLIPYAIPKNKRVIVIGSSIAYNGGASISAKGWVGLLTSKYTAFSFKNMSVPGYTTFEYLPDAFESAGYRIKPDTNVNIDRVIKNKPGYVIISLTSNDIGQGYTPDDYMRNMKVITDSLKINKINYLVTSTTLRGDFPIENRRKLLTLFYRLKKVYLNRFVDIMTATADTSTLEINKSLFINDLAHPNDKGHQAIYNKVDSVFYARYVSQ